MEKQAGVIVVLTKNGDQGVKVPLRTNTPCSFGSSIDATVRMHKENQNLKEFHCIVNVDDKGFVGILTYFLYLFSIKDVAGGFDE